MGVMQLLIGPNLHSFAAEYFRELDSVIKEAFADTLTARRCH